MSNLIINWRFGRWFFQVTQPSDWGGVNVPVRITRHPGPRLGPEPWLSLYQGGRYAVLLVVLLALIVLWVAL